MSQSYRDKVFYKFQTMQENEVFDLHIHVSPENYGTFIETSKQLIDEDLMPEHYMEFSDDYSRIKKKAKQY